MDMPLGFDVTQKAAERHKGFRDTPSSRHDSVSAGLLAPIEPPVGEPYQFVNFLGILGTGSDADRHRDSLCAAPSARPGAGLRNFRQDPRGEQRGALAREIPGRMMENSSPP